MGGPSSPGPKWERRNAVGITSEILATGPRWSTLKSALPLPSSYFLSTSPSPSLPPLFSYLIPDPYPAHPFLAHPLLVLRLSYPSPSQAPLVHPIISYPSFSPLSSNVLTLLKSLPFYPSHPCCHPSSPPHSLQLLIPLIFPIPIPCKRFPVLPPTIIY